MNKTYFESNKKRDCTGCGACALICPQKCIKMIEDEEGFLYPKIDKTKCIKCNLCIKNCANKNDKKDINERAFAVINKSNVQRENSSSGGFFYLLAEYVINNNGVVFGVTFNEDLVAIHKYAVNMKQCKEFCGSKYVRSDLKDSFQQAEAFLKQDRIVLFTGTACQINGLKKYLKKDYNNLILCDILCHANPSPKVFKFYIKNLEIKNKKKVKNVLFRSKENGWKNQTPIIEYDDGSRKEENSYFNAFVEEMINRQSCYYCQFASKRRISDITIADFWK